MLPAQDKSLEVDAVEPGKPVPLWRNVNFLLLVSGQSVSSVGSQISLVAFPLLIFALTHSPALTGLMAALRGLPYALFCLPAGALVDRWNRKLVMIVCDTGRALALGSIPILFILGRLTIVQLALVSLTEGTLFVVFNLAESASIPQVVAREQLPAATGQNEVVYSLASLLGPALGPILFSLGNTIPFMADALSYVVSVCSLCFMRLKFQRERVKSSRTLWVEIGEGMVWLWRHPLLRFLALLTFGMTTPCYGYVLILIVQAQRMRMHAADVTLGLIFAGGGVGSILGALIATPLYRRLGFGKMIIGSTSIWALTWLIYALAPNPFILGLGNAMSFIIVPTYTVVQYSYRLALIPDHLQGRVNSVFRLITFGSQPLGIALTGILLQALGPVATVVILFVPQAALAITAALNKHVRHAKPISELAVI